MMENKKNSFVQFIRGICILMVILIHCKNGAQYDEMSFEYNYGIVLRQFINFPVAVFIFFSGYYTNINKADQTWFIKRIKRLLLPYIIWSLVYMLINFATTGKFGIIRNTAFLILGLSAGHLYFIIVMIQLTILVLFIKYVWCINWVRNILFLITPIYYMIFYIGEYIFDFVVPLRTTLFPAWFIFFYLGIYLRENKKAYVFKSMYIPIIIALGLSLIESFVIKHILHSYDLATTQVKFSSAVYAICVINLLMHCKDKYSIGPSNVIYKIGNISYGVYYCHMIFIILFNKIIDISKFTALTSLLPIYQIIQLLFVIVCSYTMIMAVKTIIGREKAKKYLGF